MSAREYPIGNVRRSGGKEKYGEKSYLSGDVTAIDTVPRMRDGIDDGVDDVPPQTYEWNRTGD